MPQILMQLMRHEDITTTMKFYVGREAEATADVLWAAVKQGTNRGTIGREVKKQAGELGFEPRLKESESFVLPLHHSPKSGFVQAILAGGADATIPISQEVSSCRIFSERRSRKPGNRPKKPSTSYFPSAPTQVGKWQKKIRGTYYFGNWARRENGKLVCVDGDGWKEAYELRFF